MKPQESITLSFQCPKKLNDLQACNGGYYCDGCQKVIHDLRGIDENAIRQKMADGGADFCGIFDQRSIKTKAAFPKLQRWASFALLALGLTSCRDGVVGQLKRMDRKQPPAIPQQKKILLIILLLALPSK